MFPHYIHFYDIPGIDIEITNSDLYGILTDNNDEILDDMTNMDPGEIVELNDALPDEEQEETTKAEGYDWCPGNPDNMVEIPFTGTSGIIPAQQMRDKNPLDFFFLYFNNEMLNLILECTNKCGNNLKTQATQARARFRAWTDITINELRTFVGILLLMGTIKLNRMADYWSNHYLFRLSPRLYMARDWFYLILRALSVQFNSERNEKLAIDESLILWKGRLSFRQYLKGKAHQYGIKLYVLADASGIILKIHIYAGSQDQQVGGKNHVQKSVQLADALLAKNTYVTGTLRANRVGNPGDVKNATLKIGESCIMHNRKKIVVTKWKDRREFFFVSTEHKSDYVGTTSRRIHRVHYKPAVQVSYNKYMRAIDKHDQLLSYYCCEHKTLRWYKKVIIHIIQICVVNGFLLYNKEIKNIALYDYRKSIIESLLPNTNNMPLPPSAGKIHLPANLLKRNGKIMRKKCRVCYNKTKKKVAVLFGCPDCPGFPGLCLQCFREYHNY
uniref:SFRICE_038628 n=1 Tax=Spodoptera frugiperda TaxID=7108 RepID=A0A2H1WBY8_SPOFR